MKTIGVVIIIIGLILTFFTSFTSLAGHKMPVKKQVESVRDKSNRVNWYPLFSISIFVVGAAILGRSSEK